MNTVTIPKAPTPEMRLAGREAHYEADALAEKAWDCRKDGMSWRENRAVHVFNAMVAAAPQAMSAEATAERLPEPAFNLKWKHGAYYVSEPNIGDTDCYTADQMHEYAALRSQGQAVVGDATLEQRARELLAVEYEADGEVTAPWQIRHDELATLTGFQRRGIRAISAALRSQSPVASSTVTIEQAFYMVSPRDLTAAEFCAKVRALAQPPTVGDEVDPWEAHYQIAEPSDVEQRLQRVLDAGIHQWCIGDVWQLLADCQTALAPHAPQPVADGEHCSGLTPKQAWWAGARAALRLHPDTPRPEVAEHLRTSQPQQGAVAVIEMCRSALAEELSAWDIDPPLHHVKQAHDACVEWLAHPPAIDQQAVDDAWRDLVRRAWLTLTVECPNDPLNDELAAALAAHSKGG